MKKFFERTSKFVFSKQQTIFSSAVILALMIILSRVFGFLRYHTLATFFNKEELDIFFASFRIPDLIFEVLITGAFTSSFIPIFIKFQSDQEELNKNISSIINLILVLTVFCVIILYLTMDWLIPAITPGFSPEKNKLIIYYSRILLVGQLPILIFANILTGLGQANKIFFLTSIGPILYNIVIILATMFLAPNFGLMAPIIGVVIGGIVFFLVQLPLFYKSNFTYRLILKKTSGLIAFVRMTIPRVITVAVSQIDVTVDLTLATFLGNGAYTVFYLAQRLQLLPVSVVGVAFGQASLPYLSEIYQQKRIEDFKKIVIESILKLFFFTIPIMSFFIFARTPIVRIFFGGEKFDWAATVDTAVALSYFSLSVPFHAAYYFLTRCFYSLMDTKTPFVISVNSVAINTLLSILFVLYFKFPVWSLAISFSVSMIANVILLFIILYRRVQGFNLAFLFFETGKMLITTLLSSIVVYYLMKLMDGLIFDTSRTINVFFLLLVGSIVYFLLYLFLCWIFEVQEIYLVTRLAIRIKEYKKRIVEINAPPYE